MKKIISVILCVMFALSLAACGQNSADKATSDEPAIVRNNIAENDDMMTIDSEIGQLKYPAKWKDKVAFSADKDMVTASCGDVKLFTLYFGGNKGDVFGTLHTDNGDKELRYEMYDISEEAKANEDLFAMQEDMNVICQYLIEEGKLKT